MTQTTLSLHPSFEVGEVDPRIFGGFLEHLGRAVYGGVYEPGSRHADAHGFRTDVLSALKRLRFTAMRYPGGNFVSGYDWIDGVGPAPERPRRTDLAWQSTETNQFGTNEFISLCRTMDWTPMLAANLGTGTPADARNWLEYCNGAGGTYWSDLRREHGYSEPHHVKLWCLGNEMDGSWQIGHVPADHYAIRAQQTARLMKMNDPTLELVLCGSCGIGMPTYMDWDRTVLEACSRDVDYISLHRYVGNPKNDTEDYLAIGVSVDQQIEEMDAACRFVQAKTRSKNRIKLSFDEWNVWYRANSGADVDGRGKVAPPLLEEVYNLEDALVAAQFLNSFVRHADSVKIANLAQIVNVIAPVLTRGDDLLIQSIFHPISMFAERRKGTSLQVAIEGPSANSASYPAAPVIDASAILDRATLHLFLVNRSASEPGEVKIDLGRGSVGGVVSAEIVTGKDPKAANEVGRPPAVQAEPFDGFVLKHGTCVALLPPLSFVAATLTIHR